MTNTLLIDYCVDYCYICYSVDYICYSVDYICYSDMATNSEPSAR